MFSIARQIASTNLSLHPIPLFFDLIIFHCSKFSHLISLKPVIIKLVTQTQKTNLSYVLCSRVHSREEPTRELRARTELTHELRARAELTRELHVRGGTATCVWIFEGLGGRCKYSRVYTY